MESRTLGRLWPVSALTLGGGGFGGVWGETTREEAVATVRAAVDAGVTLIDVAPSYGDGEAERVVGAAFGGTLPGGVRISTKHRVGNPEPAAALAELEQALDASLARLRLGSVDLLFVHGTLVPDGAGDERRTPRSLFVEAVRPALERLVAQGRTGAWGITAIAAPSTAIETIADSPAPGCIQAIANALDSAGEIPSAEEPPRPRDVIAAAHERDVGVMGVRAVQAGALTDAVDRPLPAEHPTMVDFRRAAPLRAIAREAGESAAALAHRYALSMPGVDTVVLGVKNRAELAECVAAADAGPLPADLIAAIDATRAAG